MKYSGVGIRFVALLVDSLLLIPWTIFMFATFGDITKTDSSINVSLTGWPAVVWALVGLGYYVVCEAQFGGTLGRKATGTVVVSASGERISWGQSLGRNLLRVVDSFIVYLVGAIAVWSSEKNQRLGDMAAKTFVVSKDSIGGDISQ